MRKVAGGWCGALVLAGVALLIGCDRLPTSSDRIPIPRFSISPGSGVWKTKASMPTARDGAAVGVMGGLIYVATGVDPACCGTQAFEVYDPVANSWFTKTPVPTSRSYAASAVIGGKLYVVGGCINSDCASTTDLLEIYDPVADVWTTGSPIPIPRFDAAAGVINGKLYVVGGNTCCYTLNNDLEVYDPSTDKWTSKHPLPNATAAAAAAVVNGNLYVIGGVLSGGPYLGSVEVYDTAADNWTAVATMPTPRATATAGVVNGIIYVAGGHNCDGCPGLVGDNLNTMEAYDPIANMWTQLASMTTPRARLFSAVVNDTLYVIGGLDDLNHARRTNEAFNPPFNFTGFLQPIQNPPAVNSRKAKGNITLKFSLNGNQGLSIIASGYPASQQQVCGGAVTGPIVPILGSGLTYNPVNDQYNLSFKADGSWGNTCQTLSVGLTDGSVHQVQFSF